MKKRVNYTSLEKPRVKYPSGIYLIKTSSQTLPNVIDHFGVLIAGPALLSVGYWEDKPIIFHLTDTGFQIDYVEQFGNVERLGKVNQNQISQAIWRLKISFFNPRYDLFSNNCEQFARFTTEGYKQSIQLQNIVGVGLLAGLSLLIWTNNE